VNDEEMKDTKHLDEMTLLLYAERQLDRDSAQEVSLHTQTCASCMTLLRALDRESRLLTRAMLEQDEPLPARLAELRLIVKRSMQWIWGVVLGMAALGVYAVYTGYVEPWQAQLEQAGFGSTNLVSLMIFQGAFWKGWQSMFTLLEGLAVASLVGMMLLAFRRYLKRGSTLAVMFASLGLLLAVATPVPVAAADFRKGETVEIRTDETVKGDLFFSGKLLRVEGTVDGDVYVFAQQADISGHITGDLICFVQSARVSGTVDGNIRAFTNNITLSGTVGRSITAFNEVLNIDSRAKVERNVTVFSQTVAMDGKIGRDFLGMFKNATLSGTVGGNVEGRGEGMNINSSAVVGGTSKFEGDEEPRVSSGAKLASPLEYKKMEHKPHHQRDGGFYIWKLIWTAGFVLLGLVLFSLMPQFASETVQSAENLLASIGLGVLVFPGVFIAALIACCTVVGLLVGISTLFVWFIVLLSSSLVVGAILGRWLLGPAAGTWALIGRMAVGVVVVRIAMMVPWLGIFVKVAVILWGMGAVALALYRRLQPVMAPNIPSVPMGGGDTPLPPQTTVGA